MAKDGGPAFPVLPPLDNGASAPNYPYPHDGMSLRDYFAAAALQGTLSDCKNLEAILTALRKPTSPFAFTKSDVTGDEFMAQIAQNCYQFADAMILEREKS
jgi:hypothetical protein